jgi:hypothetical protein
MTVEAKKKQTWDIAKILTLIVGTLTMVHYATNIINTGENIYHKLDMIERHELRLNSIDSNISSLRRCVVYRNVGKITVP